MRIIDADALKDAHIKCPDNVSFFDFGEIVERFLQTIDEQPTADAVPVVRCKECKHRFVDGENVRFNVCEMNHNKVQSDDWFCADGERKEQTK